MFTDIKGNKRLKVGLHNHTTLSDGKRPPEEVFEIYRRAGYDAMTLTEHWNWQPERKYGDMTVLSGCEYNIGGQFCAGFVSGEGVYHITAIGCSREPALDRNDPLTAPQVADAIHAAGGFAVLAHPAWSLNDPFVVSGMDCFDAAEIYNSVSGVHSSNRADSSNFCDLLACRGRLLPLIAADDGHFYDNDACISFVCVRADDNSPESIMAALRAGDYYASQGPEIHTSLRDGVLTVDCTPAEYVAVYSDLASVRERILRQSGAAHMEYAVHPGEHFLRAEVCDALGRKAWSSYFRT